MTAEQSKIVFITGASSGIGEAIARTLTSKGHTVILSARRKALLDNICSDINQHETRAYAYALDVTDREQTKQVIDQVIEKFGRIDVMINNAGIMPLSPLNELLVDEWEQTIDVNIKGLLWGVAAVLPHMNARHSGHIINLGSIASHNVYPNCSIYCATKFAVRAISEGLRQENSQLRVTLVSPGVVTSNIADAITDEATKVAIDEFRSVAISAESIGETVAYAIEQPESVDVSEVIIRPTASAY